MLKLDFNPPRRILRQFAYIAVIGLPLLAALVLRLCGAFSWTHPVLLGIAALGVLQLIVFLVGVVAPTRVLYVGLMVVALPFGFVISQVVMALIYFLVLTPIGLVFRLIGRDVLGRKLERGRTSYWHDRQGTRDPASYFKLY